MIDVLNIGAHESNRYEVGVDAYDAQSILSEMVVDGFVQSGLGNCRAFEIASGKHGEAQQKFTQDLIDNSAGALPPMLPEDLKPWLWTPPTRQRR